MIVNDMREINIDASLVRDGGAELSRIEEKLVEMTNGCICCTLREDLLQEVTRLAQEGRFDYLLIETPGISEPLPVAEMFTFPLDDDARLGDVARLDTMLTVVDAKNILRELDTLDTLQDREMGMSDDDLGRVEALLKRMNPCAKFIRADFSDASLTEVLNTGRFDFDQDPTIPS